MLGEIQRHHHLTRMVQGIVRQNIFHVNHLVGQFQYLIEISNKLQITIFTMWSRLYPKPKRTKTARKVENKLSLSKTQKKNKQMMERKL